MRRVNSCLSLALLHDGAEITTIEGLGTPDALHPMQAAFLAHDGYQCGYCTSGQIMSAVALLKEPCGPTDFAVKELMSGNICRCGAVRRRRDYAARPDEAECRNPCAAPRHQPFAARQDRSHA